MLSFNTYYGVKFLYIMIGDNQSNKLENPD
jgi:hypothetical protein